ncbi:hypothetical protein MMC30_001560 [Trapelia coarctata]|nr:hypothetical protein [Trapelia coarctata]
MDKPKPHRRSHPTLNHLSVTPLTPAYPLPTSLSPTTTPLQPTSYITPKSLPQSPSILSRSPSLTRPSKSSHALTDLSRACTPLRPSRSASQIARSVKANAAGRRGVRSSDNESWILQTASVLTTTTAESKGQAWLATRSSSTSLENYTYPLESSYKADDEFSPVSVRYSRSGSRPGSRFTSARGSRRGSRVGVMTPMGVRTPGEEDEVEREEGDYFGGVDFVDESGVEGEEGEMRRVVWGRVGGWVDWAVGWMDWRVDEEGEIEIEREGEDDKEGKKDGEGENGGQKGGEGERKRRRRRRGEGDRIVVNRVDEVARLEVPPPEGDGGWKDAQWLLGVAKKILV